jgi:hypothetical protein
VAFTSGCAASFQSGFGPLLRRRKFAIGCHGHFAARHPERGRDIDRVAGFLIVAAEAIPIDATDIEAAGRHARVTKTVNGIHAA